jgi:hypothetical protein
MTKASCISIVLDTRIFPALAGDQSELSNQLKGERIIVISLKTLNDVLTIRILVIDDNAAISPCDARHSAAAAGLRFPLPACA